jgi:hypothetical protein
MNDICENLNSADPKARLSAAERLLERLRNKRDVIEAISVSREHKMKEVIWVSHTLCFCSLT